MISQSRQKLQEAIGELLTSMLYGWDMGSATSVEIVEAYTKRILDAVYQHAPQAAGSYMRAVLESSRESELSLPES